MFKPKFEIRSAKSEVHNARRSQSSGTIGEGGFRPASLGLATLAVTVLLLAGCGSLKGPHQQYTSPAVSGRVLEAATGQPLKGARVSRLTSRPEADDPFLKTAGEQLIADSPIITGTDGTFYIPAVRAAYLLFGPSGSLTLTLRAEHSGFLTLTTNLDLVKIKSEKTERGPEVRAGDLRLRAKE
jgi:hypothetical protein